VLFLGYKLELPLRGRSAGESTRSGWLPLVQFWTKKRHFSITQRFVGLVLQYVCLTLFLPAFSLRAQSPGLQRVLVLYSDERLLPANVIFDHSFRATFQAGATKRTEFHSEFLDVSRFSAESQQENQRDFLRRKYLDYPPDLIVAVSGSAVAFLMKYRSSLFTETPVVYLTWQGEAPPGTLSDPKAVEISTPGVAYATLKLALDLQPDTRQIAVITGSSLRDKALVDEMRKVVGLFGNRVVFSWLTDLSLPALRNELARLPDHTVALYLTLFQDAAGSRFTPQEALDQFAWASRVPIYAYYDTCLGHGIIGGSFVTFEESGRKAAQAGLRVLAGERPRDVAGSEIGEKCRSIFGFTLDEPLDFPKFIGRVHPEDRSALQQAVQQSLKAGGEFDIECRILSDSGLCWIAARGHASFDHQSKPVRLLGVCIDITSRKLDELQLQKQRDDLTHLSRVTIIGELATTLAHELNQPLGAIHSNAETAEIFLKSDPPNFEELCAILSDIRQDAWRGGEVIRRMRSLLKKQRFKREQIEIKRLIEALETLLQAVIMLGQGR
jgi:PAS domain-containing protein